MLTSPGAKTPDLFGLPLPARNRQPAAPGKSPNPTSGCRIKGTPTLWATPAREKVRTAQSCGEMTVPGPPYPSTALGDQEPVPRVAFAPHGAGGWEWLLAQKPQVVTALTKMQ